MEQKKKIKIIIIVLAVLLGLSLLALGSTLIYNKIANTTPATVTVPDNLITADEDTTKPDSSDSQAPDSSDTEKPDGSYTQTPDSSAAASSSAVPTQSTTAETKKAATIELYNKQPEENTAFAVGNMFPGDSETKYFRVRVSYHDMLCALTVGDRRKLHGSLNRKRCLFPLPITLRSAERHGNSTQTHTLGIRKQSPAFLSISSIQAVR